MNKIRVENISKTIKNNIIYKNISFEMESGKIYGFIGKNGSGKTMLFRTLAGLIKPQTGEIFIDNEKINFKTGIKNNIGIVIENIGLYPEMTGLQNLKYLAGINKIITDENISNTISLVGLDPNDKRKIKKYSLGMRQKLVLAQAFMENPELLLLDEPTNALDLESVNKIRKIIKTHANRGAIIAIASHNKEDIDTLCDKIFFINNGLLLDKSTN